ncbi:MAG: pilus assembly protein N-terminal domain-containing protein, partial [Bdellovibrionota bacterium]
MKSLVTSPGIALFLLLFLAPVRLLGAESEVPPEGSEERPPVLLGQGEQRLLRIPGLRRFSVGSPIAKAHSLSLKNDDDRLLVKGVSPGVTDLWVWKSDGVSEHRTLRVEKDSPGELTPALEKALSELSTVEILYTGAGVILRGRIESLSESAQIAAVAAAFPKEVQDETELSPGLLEFGQRRLEAWLRSARLTDELRIERIGPSVWVRGHLNQVRSQPVVEKQLRAIFPAVQLEIESLPDNAPTIYFRVYLLELQKKRFHNLGLSWPDLQQSAFRIVTGGIQNLLQLDLTLQMLEGEGSVRVLSNPELVVRAPGEAELFSGGELPIHMQSHFYSNVTWKPFGLTLKLKATHTSGDKVRLDISTEVSRLDNSITQGDVPGFQSNRMKTQVDARFGEPLFLSGLLQQDVRSQA